MVVTYDQILKILKLYHFNSEVISTMVVQIIAF